jgi:carbamoyltransferase
MRGRLARVWARWKIIVHFDGLLVVAEEEERFTRKKYDFELPLHTIRYVLEVAGITADAFDYIAFLEKPFIKFERILREKL